MADYNSLKVAELKDILKERGIPSTGLSRKAQIVEALEKHDADNVAAVDTGVPQIQDEQHVLEEVIEDAAQDDAPRDDAPGAVENTADTIADEPMADIEDKSQPDGSAELKPVENEDIQPPTAAAEETATAQIAPIDVRATEGPIVLENNDPVSKDPSTLNTPRRRLSATSVAGSASSDTRKRKRRSPTPPLSAETVNKKLKAAEDETVVKLPEDEIVDDAPVAVDRSAESKSEPTEDEGKKVLPYATSDDVMDLKPNNNEFRGRGDTPPPRLFKDERQSSPPEKPKSIAPEEDESTSPAIHPATRSIYIRDLVRPLQSQQLRQHLVDLATTPFTSPSDSILTNFHLDTLRTHAFATFTSISAAARVRSALHSRVWPDEPARKQLWVDFVPEEKVEGWIEVENAAGGRRDAKRWEVVYEDDVEGGVTAELREAAAGTSAPAQLQRQNSGAGGQGVGMGMGMPNAPLGPRGHRASVHQERRDQSPPPPSAPRQEKAAAPLNPTFAALDERFAFTKAAKPKLYYNPVSDDVVRRRLDALDAITSEGWREGSGGGSGDVRRGNEMRRYTFEDGDRVVDNGVDVPGFGRPGGGGGRGRGGGWFRGGGGRRRGDW